MPSGYNNQQTKQTGEYLVAAELCRRGLVATTFTGNMPQFDLLAATANGDQFAVQVKTSNVGTWRFSIDRFADVTFDRQRRQSVGPVKSCQFDRLVYVLVDVSGRTQNDRFFVVSYDDLAQRLVSAYKEWLEERGGKRPKSPRSLHTVITFEELEDCENQWDLFTVPEWERRHANRRRRIVR
jgi:hypothetical protein